MLVNAFSFHFYSPTEIYIATPLLAYGSASRGGQRTLEHKVIQLEEIKIRRKGKERKRKRKRKIDLYKRYRDELELLQYVEK